MQAFPDTEYSKLPEQRAGNITAEQSAYFREVIASNPDARWTFLFMHKAAWERDDNLNFAAIEQSLAERPYAVFSGHVHAYGNYSASDETTSASLRPGVSSFQTLAGRWIT